MKQAHGSSLWQEPAGSGATPAVAPVFLVRDGADWIFSATGPAGAVPIDVAGDADYDLITDTPEYLVASGADFDISASGPATALLVADGADLAISTTMTDTAAASLFDDTGGNPCAVRPTRNTLHAVQVRGDVILY